MAEDKKKRAKRQKAYNSTPEQRKKNASRKRARYAAEKAGRVKNGDGKDIDHINGNANDNSKSNLRVQKKATNRALSGKKNGMKGKGSKLKGNKNARK